MSLTNDIIKEKLIEKFGEQLTNFEEPYGMLTFEAPNEMNLKVMQFLFDDETLRFQFLTDLTAVHYPNQQGRELAVVYHLHNLVDNIRLRFKVFTDINKPDVFTATKLYSSANWMERETYDFFGVNFVGHPNLKRILNVEEMIILTLAEYGIKGDRSAGETGVWIDPSVRGKERKICAIGVRSSRWVTMHGFALNVNTDLNYFNFIIPCGIQNKQVTSIEKELGERVDFEDAKQRVKRNFEKVFDVKLKEE